MLIPEDPKKHCDIVVKVGAYEGQMLDVVLAEVQVTVGPVDPQTYPVTISPAPGLAEMSAIIKNVEDAGRAGQVQTSTDGNQVVTQVTLRAAAVPGVMSSLEQVNTSPGT